jgi:GNAT superfamily N-acetyltransferase
MGRSGRNYYVYKDWKLRKLKDEEYTKLGWFSCGDDETDEDINDYFHNDALLHKKELIAESYVFEYKGVPLALLCLQNDSIQFGEDDNKERNKFGKIIELPFSKRYNSIPAVKIGRLGVSKTLKGMGIGSRLLNLCKLMFITDNRTGCRLIMVDSYIKKIGFYEKNGFSIFPNETIEDKSEKDTVIMLCNLKNIQISP